MDTPTYDEAIYMARIKRGRAKEAMERIVEHLGGSGSGPGLEVLLDYFSNMVYGLELLLKVLAKDWEIPGKSKFRHKVGQMYAEIFARQHSNPTFMKELECAILDQKFLLEPAQGLIDRVQEIEELWDELAGEYKKRARQEFFTARMNGTQKLSTVNKDVRTSAAVGQYLMNNVGRFMSPVTYNQDPLTAEEKISMRRLQIQQLEQEIKRLEAEGDTKLKEPEICQMLHAKMREKIESLSRNMAFRMQASATLPLRFMICRVGVAWADLD